MNGASSFELPWDAAAEINEAYILDPDNVFDIFSETGGSVSLSAPGTAGLGSFDVQVLSPERLAPTDVQLGDTISRSGETLTWTPGNGSYVRVRLKLGLDVVECDSPDDGSITISAAALSTFDVGDTIEMQISRVVDYGILTDAPVGAVIFNLSSTVDFGNVDIGN